MQQFVTKVFILSFALLLSACTTLSPPPTQSQLHQRSWALRGRVAVQTANKGETASLYWQQENTHYQLRLFGPLGIGAVEVEGVPGQVELIANNGRVYQATSPEQLLQEVVGWPMPVSHLMYWVRGLPAPHVVSKITRDSEGRLQILQQEGWKITYLSYSSDQINALPRLLVCARPGLQIRLVVDQWSII